MNIISSAVTGLTAAAAKFQEIPKVAVMDFGKLSNAAGGINTDNVGLAVSDYIIQALVDSGKFKVMEKDLLEEVLAENDVHTVKALIIAQMMDVETGDIITAARCEGKSKGSNVKVGVSNVAYLTIVMAKIPQVSVHNAIKKAAYSTVDLLIKRLEDY